MNLRDYQQAAVEEGVVFLRDAQPGDRRMYCAPCGTGKSIIEIAIQRRMGEGCWITTPRTEILDGMVAKGGDPDRITTPLLLRNRMLDGSITIPEYIISDECHHDTNATANEVRLCAGEPPTVAYTATPFRGTPQSTLALRELYGAPRWVITMRQAAERGLLTIPACRTVPVLDDDEVEIINGEFKVRAIERKTVWATATSLVRDVWAPPLWPTVVSLPTVWSCQELHELLTQCGVSAVVVTADTNRDARRRAFDACIASEAVLLQVQVVSEGVDLPIRRLIDLSPTMSPVRWLQQIGRIMRPGGVSEYVCANRNLLRHGYLLEGLVPAEAFSQGQSAFPAPSRRLGIRAFGLEGVGKLKPTPVPLKNGLMAHAYCVTRGNGNLTADQYVALVLPNQAEPLWATKQKKWTHEGTVDYGTWSRCGAPVDLCGFASVPPGPLTERQAAKWKQSAGHYGLDPGATVTAKTFAVLPVLWDLHLRIE